MVECNWWVSRMPGEHENLGGDFAILINILKVFFAVLDLFSKSYCSQSLAA